jgi:hypothetical protein
LNSHQADVCLGVGYQKCPVYLKAETQPIPPYLRGTNDLPVESERRSQKRTRLVGLTIVFILVIVVAFVFLPRYFSLTEIFSTPVDTSVPATFTPRPTSTATTTRVSLDLNAGIIASFTVEAQTRIANYTATLDLTEVIETQTAARAATLTPPTRTPSKTRTPSPTVTPSPTRTPSQTTTPKVSALPSATPSAGSSVSGSSTAPASSSQVCGHTLDTPFGNQTKFLMHRVLTGENLTVYADQYQTTTDAIVAINYHLPLPVWADWVVIIPVGYSDVSSLPPFEPYSATNERMSIEAMAGKLNTDLELFRTYNAFDGTCGVFSGWLLVPRVQATPTPQ